MAPIGVRYSRSTVAAKVLLRFLLVHWIVSAIFRGPPALGALGILDPPDPLVLLVLVLGVSAVGSSAETSASCSS
jgi:hypothetical protein